MWQSNDLHGKVKVEEDLQAYMPQHRLGLVIEDQWTEVQHCLGVVVEDQWTEVQCGCGDGGPVD